MDDAHGIGGPSPAANPSPASEISPVQCPIPLEGTFRVVLLYDVAEEVDLEKLRKLLHPNAGTSQKALRRRTPSYMRFEHPPVMERLGAITLGTGEVVETTIRYYSYGVAVIEYEVPFACHWETLAAQSSRWIEGGGLEAEGRALVLQQLALVGPAITKPSGGQLSEHYLLITLDQVESNGSAATAEQLLAEHGHQIGQLLMGELTPLADKLLGNILEHRLSYYASDLVVVGPLAAFIYDRSEDASAVGRILEYAKMQLLEFRYYDGLISGALANLYDVLEKERSVLFSRWTLSSDTRRFDTVRLDVMELTERIDNAIKFVSDVYYARLYREAASRLGVVEYRKLVDEKLDTARELSEVMVSQFNEARNFVLEVGVAILALLDVIFLFRGK